MANEIIEYQGKLYGTGLIQPVNRVSGYRLFMDEKPMLTGEQVNKVISDPSRKSGRKRFGSDWIMSQKHLGACCGFACAGGGARARVRRGLPRKALSGFAMYSAINGGVDRGALLKDGMEWMMRHGIPEAIAGERPEYRWGRIPQVQKDSMASNVMLECYAMETELELAVACALGFDCIIAVHASNRWSNLDSNGISGESHGVGNHAVLVDDVVLSSSGEWLFDMANSWDVSWGQQGRSYQTWRRHLSQTIKYHQFFAIRSTVDGK
jgi:hypothetical protein